MFRSSIFHMKDGAFAGIFEAPLYIGGPIVTMSMQELTFHYISHDHPCFHAKSVGRPAQLELLGIQDPITLIRRIPCKVVSNVEKSGETGCLYPSAVCTVRFDGLSAEELYRVWEFVESYAVTRH